MSVTRTAGYLLLLIYDRIAKMPASYRKSGSGYTMVMSDFRLEVEIRQFRTHSLKNMQNNNAVRCPYVRNVRP